MALVRRHEAKGWDPRTLVMGLNWLGDMVMSLPAVVALRAYLEGEHLHVAAPEVFLPLIRMAVQSEGLIGWPPGSSTLRRVRLVRGGQYRRAVLFPNSFRSALIAWCAGIPERWGYTGQMRRWLLSRPVPGSLRPRGVHQSHHYLTLIQQMGWGGHDPPGILLRVPEEARTWARQEVLHKGGRPVVGICPGATFGAAKRWPAERFAEAARSLRERWGAAILLMGNRAERSISESLSQMIGGDVLDFTGRTDIERLAALLEVCTLVLANDSGPMHLASVLGTPVVALFASTDPTATAPMGPHRIVRSRVECAPCLKRRCPEGTYRCQEAIQVEEVLRAADSLLEGGSGAPRMRP